MYRSFIVPEEGKMTDAMAKISPEARDDIRVLLLRAQSFFNGGSSRRSLKLNRSALEQDLASGIAEGTGSLEDPGYIGTIFYPHILNAQAEAKSADHALTLVHNFLYHLKEENWKGWKHRDNLNISYQPLGTTHEQVRHTVVTTPIDDPDSVVGQNRWSTFRTSSRRFGGVIWQNLKTEVRSSGYKWARFLILAIALLLILLVLIMRPENMYQLIFIVASFAATLIVLTFGLLFGLGTAIAAAVIGFITWTPRDRPSDVNLPTVMSSQSQPTKPLTATPPGGTPKTSTAPVVPQVKAPAAQNPADRPAYMSDLQKLQNRNSAELEVFGGKVLSEIGQLNTKVEDLGTRFCSVEEKIKNLPNTVVARTKTKPSSRTRTRGDSRIPVVNINPPPGYIAVWDISKPKDTVRYIKRQQ